MYNLLCPPCCSQYWIVIVVIHTCTPDWNILLSTDSFENLSRVILKIIYIYFNFRPFSFEIITRKKAVDKMGGGVRRGDSNF